MLSASSALIAGHLLAGQFDGHAEVAEQELSDVDVKAELLQLLKRAQDSYDSIDTGHIKFKFTRTSVKMDVTREQCERWIENIGEIDSQEKLLELMQHFFAEPLLSKAFVDAELHFDRARTRESIDNSKGKLNVHINDGENSLMWDPANYQLDVKPSKKNTRYQITKRDFVRPLLPTKDGTFFRAVLEELDKSQVNRADGDFMIETTEFDGSVSKMVISGDSGFPSFRASNRPSGSIKVFSGWKQYRDKIWYPNVVFELRFRDGKLAYFSAQVVTSARFNVELADHLFVMSVPAGTTYIRDGQFVARLNEDVFDVLSKFEISEATKHRKRELTPEEKRGALAARKLYRLKEGEVFKRLGPPFPLARKYALQMQGRVPDGQRPQETSLIFKSEDDGKLSAIYTFNGGVFNVRTIAEKIFGLHPSAIEGPEDVLNMRLPGDFVVRDNADKTEIADAFRRALEAETQSRIEVKLEEVSRPVYVVSGDFEAEGDRNGHVVVNSGTKPNRYPEIISSGNLEKFLTSLSEYINVSVKMGTIDSTEDEFTWRESRYSKEAKQQINFNVETVLQLVSEQTGLKFKKRESKKAVVVIRPIGD
jgi:hypothetical protein